MLLIFLILFSLSNGIDLQDLSNPTIFEVNTVQDTQRVVKMEFDKRHKDFGKMVRGEKRNSVFTFTNTGNEDIIIDLVSGCDCTTLDWPRLPIAPGAEGAIDVLFDSSEKEESGTVEIDIYLKNKDPKTGYGMLEIVSYSFELIEK
ncbi:MAG: DUF1573 domain-containing protein [Saprospiraceae bacterium]|nr:DUF1573 domain-containing protein [Saprospiraceae bacterium]